MSMRSRTDHSIPSDIIYSATIGGRREVKYEPFVQVLSGSSPTSIDEGTTGVVNFLTNLDDGTYNFTVTPTARITVPTGTFSVSSGLGSINVLPVTNTQRQDDVEAAIRIKNPANDTLLLTLSTSVVDASPITQPAVGFVEVTSKGDTRKYEDSDTD